MKSDLYLLEDVFPEIFSGTYDYNHSAQLCANFLENAVNNLCFSPKNFAEEIHENKKADRNFRLIAYAWLPRLSEMYLEQRYDARNEDVCRFGYEAISDETVRETVKEEMEKGREVEFYRLLDKLTRMHRYLQTSFSLVCFHYLAAYGSDAVKAKFRDF